MTNKTKLKKRVLVFWANKAIQNLPSPSSKFACKNPENEKPWSSLQLQTIYETLTRWENTDGSKYTRVANETVVGDIFCLFETRKKKKLTIHREFETSLSYKLSSLAGNRSIRKIFKSLAESLIWVLFFISIPQKSPSLF